jgi:hypothetical protein
MLHISADKLAFRPEVDARERQRIADYVGRHHRPLVEV